MARVYRVFIQRPRLCGCALKLVCISVQRFDHMQLHWKPVSSSLHYELILEPAAIERRKWPSLHISCWLLFLLAFSHLCPQSLSVCCPPACLSVSLPFFIHWLPSNSVCVCVDVFVCVLGCTRERKIVTKRGDRKVLEQNNKIISVLQEWTFDGVLFA